MALIKQQHLTCVTHCHVTTRPHGSPNVRLLLATGSLRLPHQTTLDLLLEAEDMLGHRNALQPLS